MKQKETFPERIAQCTVEPLLGGISIAGLACLHGTNHEAMAEVEFECSQGCGTKLKGPRFFSPLTACDACREKADKQDKWDKAKLYWESICPENLRSTDKEHAGFPKAIYDDLKQYIGQESLLLFGPTGRGKTRVGALLLKRCLVKRNAHVAFMWPEELKSVKDSRDRLAMVHKWGRYDLLMLDDPLSAGAADERIVDFLKDLLDYRMREGRHQIITSQVGSSDLKEAAGKFGNLTRADKERLEAIIRRISETCRTVSFGSAQPVPSDAETF